MAVIRGTADERCDQPLRARVRGLDAALIVQADVSAISVEVWDIKASPNVRVYEPDTLDKTEVVFDSAQEWGVDDDGFNFAFVLPGDALPAESIYRVEVTFSLGGGATIVVKFELNTVKTFTGDTSPEED